MEIILEYLISAGIFGFGVWILAAASAGSDLYSIWILLGFLPIAVGLISLYGVIKNRTA
jgi:hypothetical protein